MKKGFSLIILVVTIAVMLIIVGTVFLTSEKLSDESKAMIILDEMKILQAKIYEYQLNHEDDSNKYPYKGTLVTNGEYINYYELSKTELEQMGIKNIENTYLVDYISQDIVFKEGISINGKMCYTINEINEEANVLKN